MIKVYFNGFWSGFHTGENAVNDKFFLELLRNVYNLEVIVGNFEDSEILIENTQVNDSLKKKKLWKHTYLFSGESYIRQDKDEYDCVLYGNRTHKNIVNVPLYIPYIVSSFNENIITKNTTHERNDIPEKDVIVFVSNPRGEFRNNFLCELEKHMNVTYAGHYKNNIGGPLKCNYNSKEYVDYVSQFKYIISMENSEEDTYITEKIMHGIIAKTIPVYWGSKHVLDYFNNERILNVSSYVDIQQTIKTMTYMTPEEWKRRVNTQPFTEYGSMYGLKMIAKEIRNLLFDKKFPLIKQIIFICNPEFEKQRFESLINMCETNNISMDMVSFVCPTYKNTITDDDMKRYIKDDLSLRIRYTPTKKAELSLTLNWKATLDYIEKMYKDGIFLTFESDVFAKDNINNFNECLLELNNKKWDCIHVGGIDSPFEGDTFINGVTPYRTCPNNHLLKENSVEDLSSQIDKIRFIRKFHTRCTDSLLWSYNGIVKFLRHMKTDENYGVPFDYYMINKCETDMLFKHYWTNVTYFDQKSNRGFEPSTIQNSQ